MLQKHAAALGLFTKERDLLRCPHCGLQEDVDVTGRLLTYFKGRRQKDTGLRFRRLNQQAWFCPRCQAKIH